MGETQKHRDFVRESMDRKLVTDLPGIGATAGGALRDGGFSLAYNVLGQFLILNKDEEKFKAWLLTFGANRLAKDRCFTALNGWCQQHL